MPALSPFLKAVFAFRSVLTLSRVLAARPRAMVLRYHSVAEAHDRPELYLAESLTLPPAVFDRQIRFLSGHYRIIALEDLVNRLRQGRNPYRGALAITFDDGYRDNYERAFPILRHYRAPATFYLTTGCIDNRQILWTAYLRYLLTVSRVETLQLLQPWGLSFDLTQPVAREKAFTTLVVYMKNIPTPERHRLLSVVAEELQVSDTSPLEKMMMSWGEMREMHAHGMSFGAHTVTHPNLPNTSVEEAEREIRESKEMLEQELRAPVHHFAYPNGRGSSHLTAQIKQLVCRLGFRSAVTSFSGCVQKGDDLFALKRVGVYKKHGSLPQLSWDIERSRWNR